MPLRLLDGLYWPESDEFARPVILEEVGPAISWMKAHQTRWDCCIQAGGNVGVYAQRLSTLFKKVLTVEPDRDNYDALQRNLGPFPLGNVYHIRAALGAEPGKCEIDALEPGNCGAHRIAFVKGLGVPVVPIDGLNLKPDLIWLDIEGMELPALRGATRVLAECKPTVIVEMKNLGGHYGYADSEIPDFLARFGYAFKSSHGNDQMFQCP